MKEEWRDIKGFEGVYMVSNTGKVMSFPRKGTKHRKPSLRALSKTRDGYLKVRLIGNGKDVTARVHRLVAEAFIPNPDGKETVNHIDGNKENNAFANLEWADRHEQLEHAYRMGLKTAMKGVNNPAAKLSAEQVEEIKKEYVRRSREQGTVALGKKYGVNNSTVGDILRGVTYG